MNLVDIHRLKPHPKNADYFTDVAGEKYEEIKRSIEANGIRDPLKVLPDYTVIAGHQRLRIAAELGLAQVPVVVCDIPVVDAEYLLIADNEERRGSDEDPMRKARRAKFLKEYWGIKGRGPSKSFNQNGENSKSSADVAEAVDTDAAHLPRLLKLNDLIEPLQVLVSSGKLGTTAAEQLAHLTVEDQKRLYDAFGDWIGQQSVAEIKRLRTDMEALRKEKEQSEKAYRQAQASLKAQQETVKELQRKLEASQNSSDAEIIQAKLTDAQTQINQLQIQLEQARSEKKLVEAGAEKLAEARANELLETQHREWDEKLKKVKERNKTLNEENQRLSGENSKLSQTNLELRHQEFELARYRAEAEDHLRAVAGELEKAILSIRDAWNGPLQGDGKLLHSLDFYAKRFAEQIQILQQITEARNDNESIVETTAAWN